MKRDLRTGRVNVHKFFHHHMNRPKVGTRYTTYDTKQGGTLTIVNLKQFSEWLQGAVLREKLKEMQQTMERTQGVAPHLAHRRREAT